MIIVSVSEKWLDLQVERITPFAKINRERLGFDDPLKLSDTIKGATLGKDENPFWITGGVSVFLYKKKIFVQIFGCYEFVDDDDRFTDFHYQNQVDSWFDDEFYEGKMTKEDHKKAERNWRYRKKVWDAIYDKYWNAEQAGIKYDFGSTIHDIHYVARNVYKRMKEDVETT